MKYIKSIISLSIIFILFQCSGKVKQEIQLDGIPFNKQDTIINYTLSDSSLILKLDSSSIFDNWDMELFVQSLNGNIYYYKKPSKYTFINHEYKVELPNKIPVDSAHVFAWAKPSGFIAINSKTDSIYPFFGNQTFSSTKPNKLCMFSSVIKAHSDYILVPVDKYVNYMIEKKLQKEN